MLLCSLLKPQGEPSKGKGLFIQDEPWSHFYKEIVSLPGLRQLIALLASGFQTEPHFASHLAIYSFSCLKTCLTLTCGYVGFLRAKVKSPGDFDVTDGPCVGSP